MTGQSINILLVEDSPDDAELILAALHDGGIDYELTRIMDEPAYRRSLAESSWDLVLSDYSLPSFSGAEALRLLQESGLDIPFILLSGYLGEDAAVEIMRAGANDFVHKQKLARLVPAIQREMREAQMRTERRLAQEAVAASERLLQGVMQSIGEGIVVLSADGHCQYLNRVAERLLGWNAVDAFGHHYSDVLHFQDLPGSAERPHPGIIDLILQEGWTHVSEEGLLRSRDGTLVPVMCLASQLDQEGAFPRVVVAIRDITLHLRREQELRASKEQLRALSGHIETARETERTRIARELHDELGQRLLAIKIQAAWLRDRGLDATSDVPVKAQALLNQVDDTVESVRRISSDLRPSMLDDLGLVAALEWLTNSFGQRTGLDCELAASCNEESIGADVATAVFRVVQEAMTNAAKHAQAGSVHVSLTQNGELLDVVIEDDGRGFSVDDLEKAGSFGLIGMRERAAVLGGSWRMEPGAEKGTRIVVQIPIRKRAAA